MKHINMSLTDERHKKIKKIATDKNLTMPEVLGLMIDNYIDKSEKESLV